MGTATVALLATMAVSHARAEEVFEPSESPYPTEPGVTWHVGRQSDGWAPVMLEGECGPGTKQVELEFTPARSVTLLGHEGTRTAGGRLSLTIALEVTAPWSVSMSATGRITVEVSCLVEDNVVELSGSAEIDTTTADVGALGVSATPSDAVFHPGGEIEIAVEGFQPNDELTIDMYSSPVRLGTARTDARGRALIRSRIPDDTTEGTHHIVVTDSSGRRALFRFRVGPRPAFPELGKTTPSTPPQQAQQAIDKQAGNGVLGPRPPHRDTTSAQVRHVGARPGLPRTGS